MNVYAPGYTESRASNSISPSKHQIKNESTEKAELHSKEGQAHPVNKIQEDKTPTYPSMTKFIPIVL